MRNRDYFYLFFAHQQFEKFTFLEDPEAMYQQYMDEARGKCCIAREQIKDKYRAIIQKALDEETNNTVDK